MERIKVTQRTTKTNDRLWKENVHTLTMRNLAQIMDKEKEMINLHTGAYRLKIQDEEHEYDPEDYLIEYLVNYVR